MSLISIEEQDLKISIDCLKTVENNWEFFFENKRKDEILGIASVKKENILWTAPPYDYYRKYLESGRFIDPEIPITRRNQDYKFFQTFFELFPKLVWLLDDFLKEERFKNLVGLMYNPTLKAYEIHPGASRQILYQIWSKRKVRGLVFCPVDVDLKREDFEVIFNSGEEVEKYFSKNKVSIGLTPDRGTLFPHIHFDMDQIDDKALVYHSRINKYLDNTFLYYPQFEKLWPIPFNIPTKSNHTEIILDEKIKDNELYQLVALAAACLGMNVEFKGIKIIHKVS